MPLGNGTFEGDSGLQFIFICVCKDVRVGPLRRLSAEELMLFNCGVEEVF